MVQPHENPEGHPERRGEDHVRIVQEQYQLENGRREMVLLAVIQVAGEVAHEALVEAMVQIRWLDPDVEDQILSGRGMGPESVPVFACDGSNQRPTLST